MGHAQKKSESFQSRTMLPPALPTRSGFAPKAQRSSAPAPRLLPAPGLAALTSAPTPKSPLPASDLKLAILPQWADANAPLLPAKKNPFGLGFWIGSTTLSLVVGALVAAGVMGARLPETHSVPAAQTVAVVHETQAVAHEAAPVQPTAAPDMEIALDEVHTAPALVLVPEVTVTAGKAAKHSSKPIARAKAKSSGPKAASVLSTSWQPEPEAAPAAEETTATEAAPEAVSAPEAAPEAVSAPEAAPEPPKPVLPEQLTREQVRQGMESKRNAVITCAKGDYGKVLADITISPSGKVTSSLIDGTWAGTSVGSCMAGALRGAQFPAFSGPEIQVRYPFSF